MIVVDTDVIFAVADASDAAHDACDDLLAVHPTRELIVPTTVIVERSWLIEDRQHRRCGQTPRDCHHRDRQPPGFHRGSAPPCRCIRTRPVKHRVPRRFLLQRQPPRPPRSVTQPGRCAGDRGPVATFRTAPCAVRRPPDADRARLRPGGCDRPACGLPAPTKLHSRPTPATASARPGRRRRSSTPPTPRWGGRRRGPHPGAS